MKTSTYVLPVVILLLVASVGTRFGGSAAAALAKGAETLAQNNSKDTHTPAPDVAALLEALKTRELAVVEREAALDERHAQLQQIEQDLRAQLDELRQAEVAVLDELRLLFDGVVRDRAAQQPAQRVGRHHLPGLEGLDLRVASGLATGLLGGFLRHVGRCP